MLPIALALTLLTPPQAAADGPAVQVSVDSARKVVRLAAGPFEIVAAPDGAAPAGPGGAAMSEHGNHAAAPFLTFKWPTGGWLRGVSLRITDAAGRELPRRLIHHINVVNLDRRQLLYPAPERTIALGQETEDVRLPATVGIPIRAGTEMGLVLVWHNTTDSTWDGVTVTLDVDWLPANTAPRPLDVLLVYMDVRYPIGQPVDFDLPAGAQRFTADFTMPITGRVIGAGGHLHDYGTGLALAELRDGRERNVISLGTRLDADGRLIAVERKYPGIRGNGIRLAKGRTYRMTGSYLNSSGTTLEKGAMVHLILLFAPDRISDWPEVDHDEPDFARDVAFLKQRGMQAAHRH